MRPTVADVAERAGVSTSTVSLVLNNKPGISPEVRAAVLQAVNELGYRLPERRSPKPSPETKTITVVHYASQEAGEGSEVSGLFVNCVVSIQDFLQGKNVNWALIANYRDGDGSHL